MDLYDSVTEEFIRRGVAGKTAFPIRPDSAVVLALLPAARDLRPGRPAQSAGQPGVPCLRTRS